MRIPYHKKWIVLEREDYAHYLFVTSTWEGFTVMPHAWGFQDAHWLSAEYKDSAVTLFITRDDYKKATSSYFEMIFTEPKKWDTLHHETHRYSDALISVSKAIAKLNVRDLRDAQLLSWRKKFERYHKETHDRRGPMFFIETVDNVLTNYLIAYLAERIEDVGEKKLTPFYAFQMLTTPTKKSALDKEKESMIRVARVASKEKREQALSRHARRFAWMEYGLKGKVLDREHFRKELSLMRRRNPDRVSKKLAKEHANLKQNQKVIIKKLGIHDQHKKIFDIARDTVFYKAYSKDAQFFGYYSIERLLKEIGRRSGLSLEQVRYLTIGDYAGALKQKGDYSDLANERMKYSLHFSDKGKTKFYHGDEARQVRKKLRFITKRERIEEGKHIKGQPAVAGMATGKVKIINTPAEMLKMHQGDILVSHMTNPDIVPAMKKAAGIVTDLGGITCHAAIVSRELGTPCIIGTKAATQILKDGDRVEVDAEKGEVRKI